MSYNYTRQSTFGTDDTIAASLFNEEYDQLLLAFTYSATNTAFTGHRHDGTSGQGGNIYVLGDIDFKNKVEIGTDTIGFYIKNTGVTEKQLDLALGVLKPDASNAIDLGSATRKYKDVHVAGVITTGDLTASGTVSFGSISDGTITATAFVDEDNMASNSATLIPTQQSVKAYVDSAVSVYDDTAIQEEVDLNTAKVSNVAHPLVETAVPIGAVFTDTNTTYVSSDFDHDSLTGFVADEHIDWTTDQGTTNIHSGNYTNSDGIYSGSGSVTTHTLVDLGASGSITFREPSASGTLLSIGSGGATISSPNGLQSVRAINAGVYIEGTIRTNAGLAGTSGDVMASTGGGDWEWITPVDWTVDQGGTNIHVGNYEGGGDALVANPLSQFAATTSAQLAGVLSDETGSGAAVFATSPTLITPALGTPSALVATNLTGTASGLTVGATTGVAAGATANDTDANLKARANHTGTQAASTVTVDNSGHVVNDSASLQGFADNVEHALLKDRGTGVASSYVSTVSVGGTTFSQPEVHGEINSDEGFFHIDYVGATGITVTNLNSSSTYVYIDSANALQQQTATPTRQDWSRKMFTMRIAVDTDTNLIVGFEYLNNPTGHYTNSMRDIYSYLLAQGVPFKKDQTVTGRADLGFDVAAGSIMEFGGTGDINNANIKSFDAVSNASYSLLSRTAVASTETDLVKFWDNSGTITALGSTTWVGHRLYRFSSGNFAIQYGQGNYANKTLAKAGVLTEEYEKNPRLLNATFFGWWLISSTATVTNGTTLTDFVPYTLGIQGGSSGALGSALLKGNNLGDLTDVEQAKSNLAIVETLGVYLSAPDVDAVAATGVAEFRLPSGTIQALRLSCPTAPTGSAAIVDVNESGVSILSTKLSIDSGELTSTTASTAVVISDSAIADHAAMSVDLDQVGAVAAGQVYFLEIDYIRN
jgi:hypothetical protein